MFRTHDKAELRNYLQSEWTKIKQGRVSAQDFAKRKPGSDTLCAPPPAPPRARAP